MTLRDLLDSATERERQSVTNSLRRMWISRERIRRRRRKVAVARLMEELGDAECQHETGQDNAAPAHG